MLKKLSCAFLAVSVLIAAFLTAAPRLTASAAAVELAVDQTSPMFKADAYQNDPGVSGTKAVNVWPLAGAFGTTALNAVANAGGKLNLTVGKSNEWEGSKIGSMIVYETTLADVATFDTVKIKLQKQEDSSYLLSVGPTYTLALTGLTAADFTDADGKTYLSFAVFSSGVDSEISTNFSIHNLSNVFPAFEDGNGDGGYGGGDGGTGGDGTGSQPTTGSNKSPALPVTLLVSSAALAVLVLVRRKRRAA